MDHSVNATFHEHLFSTMPILRFRLLLAASLGSLYFGILVFPHLNSYEYSYTGNYDNDYHKQQVRQKSIGKQYYISHIYTLPFLKTIILIISFGFSFVNIIAS